MSLITTIAVELEEAVAGAWQTRPANTGRPRLNEPHYILCWSDLLYPAIPAIVANVSETVLFVHSI